MSRTSMARPLGSKTTRSMASYPLMLGCMVMLSERPTVAQAPPNEAGAIWTWTGNGRDSDRTDSSNWSCSGVDCPNLLTYPDDADAVVLTLDRGRAPVPKTASQRSVTKVGASSWRAGGNLPPGGSVVRIDTGFYDTFPSLNDYRQIAFMAVTDEGRDTFLYDGRTDTIERLTADEVLDGAPNINNDGWVVFPRGIFDNNTDIALWRNGELEMLTDTPFGQENIPILNDGGLAVWYVNPCCPSENFPEIELYDFQREEASRLTFAAPIAANQSPSLNNQGIVGWMNLDWTFGLNFLFHRGLLYDNGKITPMPTKNRSGLANVNARGQILWGSNRKTFLTENDETRRILDFSASRINDRGDLDFGTGTAVSWLLRNGVYYQTFFGIDINFRRMNNRGESVGMGVSGEDFGDLFAMFIDSIPGDHDEDGDVDLDDVAGFVGCMRGPAEGPLSLECEPLDFDDDDDVDLGDFAAMQVAYTGDCAVGITTPPMWKGACVGEPIEFSVDVRGPAASYQWRKYQDDIQGATDPTFRIDSVRLSDDGFYGVRIMTECGWEVLSDERFRIRATSFRPAYREQPQSQTVCPGEDVRFCAGFVDSDYIYESYQWEKDGEEMDPEEDWWCHIIRDVQADDAGEYRLAATNACGTTLSSIATLTVEEPILPPLVTVHPHEEITMRQGGTAPFYIRAPCAERYQWQRDGQDIAGATERELSIYPVTCADAGQYTVVVSNDIGSVTTQAGILSVPDCP